MSTHPSTFEEMVGHIWLAIFENDRQRPGTPPLARNHAANTMGRVLVAVADPRGPQPEGRYLVRGLRRGPRSVVVEILAPESQIWWEVVDPPTDIPEGQDHAWYPANGALLPRLRVVGHPHLMPAISPEGPRCSDLDPEPGPDAIAAWRAHPATLRWVEIQRRVVAFREGPPPSAVYPDGFTSGGDPGWKVEGIPALISHPQRGAPWIVLDSRRVEGRIEEFRARGWPEYHSEGKWTSVDHISFTTHPPTLALFAEAEAEVKAEIEASRARTEAWEAERAAERAVEAKKVVAEAPAEDPHPYRNRPLGVPFEISVRPKKGLKDVNPQGCEVALGEWGFSILVTPHQKDWRVGVYTPGRPLVFHPEAQEGGDAP